MSHEVPVDEHIIYGLFFFCIPLNFCVIISCTSCNLLFTNNTLDPATSQSKQRMDQLLVLAPRIVSGVHHCFFKMQPTCGILMTSAGTIIAEFVPSANELHLIVFTDNQIASARKGWFWSLYDVKLHPRNCWTSTQQWVLNETPTTAKNSWRTTN